MVRWRHMTGSIQERSHFLAPTVKNHWHNHSLKAHENGHMGGKSYACLTCHMSFTLSHYLKRHAMIHGGEKPFSLSKCVKAFLEVVNWKHKWPTRERSPLSVKNVKGHLYKVQSSSLKTHQRIHAAEMPFTFTKCCMSFKQSRALKMQERIHTREKLFFCSKCDKSHFHQALLWRKMKLFTQGRMWKRQSRKDKQD